jgi:hypothetical protein
MITVEQQEQINEAAAIMSDALRRAKGSASVAAAILAHELLLARRTLNEIDEYVKQWRAEVES